MKYITTPDSSKVEKIPNELELGEKEAIDLQNTKYNMQDIKNIKIGHRRLQVYV